MKYVGFHIFFCREGTLLPPMPLDPASREAMITDSPHNAERLCGLND